MKKLLQRGSRRDSEEAAYSAAEQSQEQEEEETEIIIRWKPPDPYPQVSCEICKKILAVNQVS